MLDCFFLVAWLIPPDSEAFVSLRVRRYQRLAFNHKLYQVREERGMKPDTFASLVSARLSDLATDAQTLWVSNA